MYINLSSNVLSLKILVFYRSTTVAVDAPTDFPPGIREIPITLTSSTYNQMLQQKYEEQMSSSTTTTTTNQQAHQNSGNCSSKKMREFDTAQWADKNLTAKPYCSGKRKCWSRKFRIIQVFSEKRNIFIVPIVNDQ